MIFIVFDHITMSIYDEYVHYIITYTMYIRHRFSSYYGEYIHEYDEYIHDMAQWGATSLRSSHPA